MHVHPLLAATAALVVPLLLSMEAPAQIEVARIVGAAAGDHAGRSVAPIFDHRLAPANTASAIAVGAPGASGFGPAGVGTVTVYRYVPARPDPNAPGLALPGTGILVPVSMSLGGQTGDLFGWALAGGFDTNGDGVTDLAIGAPGTALGAQANAGLLRVQSGLPGAFGFATSTAGLGVGEEGGRSVACVGDLDLNGTLDFAFGAPNGSQTECLCVRTNFLGEVRIVDGQGATTTTLTSVLGQVAGRPTTRCCLPPCDPCFDDHVGDSNALTPLGDIDGDGAPEFVIGVPTRGLVWILGMSNGALVGRATLTRGDSEFGASVAGLDDLDGDSVPELAVGAPGSARVRVFSGASLLTGAVELTTLDFATHAPGGGGRFGQTLAGLGDCDGDGFADLLVGAPLSTPDVAAVEAGQAFVFSGADFHLLGFASGDRHGDRFGAAVSRAPDLTGDGLPEFVVGAPLGDVVAAGNTLVDAGYARVFTLDPRGLLGATRSGSGCAALASGAPGWSLPNGPAAVDGAEFTLGVAGGVPGQLAVVMIGFARLSPPTPLPLLTPGCTLQIVPLVQPVVTQRGGGAGQGFARRPMPLPAVPALRGVTFLAQWYTITGGTALDGAVTDVAAVTIR